MNKLFVQVERAEDLIGREDDYFTQPKQKRKPTTHYDLLVRKSPEELAKFLAEYRCVYKASHCMEPNCEQCWLNWLKQEAEERET